MSGDTPKHTVDDLQTSSESDDDEGSSEFLGEVAASHDDDAVAGVGNGVEQLHVAHQPAAAAGMPQEAHIPQHGAPPGVLDAPKVCGVGISFTKVASGDIKITGIMPGSPAYMCDALQVGDVMVKVDGLSIIDKSQEEIINLVVGVPGTVVSLTIQSQYGYPHVMTAPFQVLPFDKPKKRSSFLGGKKSKKNENQDQDNQANFMSPQNRLYGGGQLPPGFEHLEELRTAQPYTTPSLSVRTIQLQRAMPAAGIPGPMNQAAMEEYQRHMSMGKIQQHPVYNVSTGTVSRQPYSAPQGGYASPGSSPQAPPKAHSPQPTEQQKAYWQLQQGYAPNSSPSSQPASQQNTPQPMPDKRRVSAASPGHPPAHPKSAQSTPVKQMAPIEASRRSPIVQTIVPAILSAASGPPPPSPELGASRKASSQSSVPPPSSEYEADEGDTAAPAGLPPGYSAAPVPAGLEGYVISDDSGYPTDC